MTGENDIITRILAGDETVLENIYLEQREPFIHWIKQQYQVPQEEGIELFQLAVVIFYDNVISGKLTELTSSIATYLFRIGPNKAFEYHRANQKKHQGGLEDTLLYHVAEENEVNKAEVEDNYRIMDEGMQQLGEPCRGIIHGFYVLRQTMDELAERLDYKNADTIKNLKYKCLKRLQKICEALKAQITAR